MNKKNLFLNAIFVIVYNLKGNEVYRGKLKASKLPYGVYTVKQGQTTTKVIL